MGVKRAFGKRDLRLIDADALIAAYDKAHVGAPGRARKLMEEAPTVDAAPVVHGRWHVIEDFYNGGEHYQCSNCEEEWVCNEGTPAENNMNYCPNCGAKMGGDL